MSLILFPINIRLKICVIKSLINVLDSVPDQYKTQEMCDKIVSEDPFKLKYCHNRYKTQEMCNKAVDDFLPALKFVSD